jgi:hypothetical protein
VAALLKAFALLALEGVATTRTSPSKKRSDFQPPWRFHADTCVGCAFSFQLRAMLSPALYSSSFSGLFFILATCPNLGEQFKWHARPLEYYLIGIKGLGSSAIIERQGLQQPQRIGLRGLAVGE